MQSPPRRRGRNFLLVVLVAVGLVAAFMLGARTNDDPGATDQLPGDSSPVDGEDENSEPPDCARASPGQIAAKAATIRPAQTNCRGRPERAAIADGRVMSPAFSA